MSPSSCWQFWGEFLFLETESWVSGPDFWVRAQCRGETARFGFPKEGLTQRGPAGQAEGQRGRHSWGRSVVGPWGWM